jgi:hypothetical protein
VVFYKNQARLVVIFFLIDRKISNTANFGRTYPRIMCYCGGGQVIALNRMAPVLAYLQIPKYRLIEFKQEEMPYGD